MPSSRNCYFQEFPLTRGAVLAYSSRVSASEVIGFNVSSVKYHGHMHINREFREMDAWAVHEVYPCVHIGKNEQSTRRNQDETYRIAHSSITASLCS